MVLSKRGRHIGSTIGQRKHENQDPFQNPVSFKVLIQLDLRHSVYREMIREIDKSVD